jgi:hypothetical protein
MDALRECMANGRLQKVQIQQCLISTRPPSLIDLTVFATHPKIPRNGLKK